MKILFTTPLLEHPPAGGPQLRIENTIKALSKVCDLDIIYRAYRPCPEVDAAALFYKNYTKNYSTIYVNEFAGEVSGLRMWILRMRERIFRQMIQRHAEFILNHVEQNGIDVVWFGYGNISYPLIKRIRNLRPSLRVICDTDSVWSRFVLRELPYAKKIRKVLIFFSGLKKQREEKNLVEMCDVTTAVSEVDADYYRGLTTNVEKIHIFSNVIDVLNYTTPVPAPNSFKRPSIYLAGTFGHYNSPMDAAARWVLEDILPCVWRTHPELHFYIVGRDSDKGFGHLNNPRVTVTGRLESVLPYLQNSSIALVPLKFESGTRFKILEAGACSVPIVSTTLGAEGIPVFDGEHILIADTPNDFARAIIALLEDQQLAVRLAQNCYRLVSQHYSVEVLVEEAKNILRFLNHD